MRYFFIGLLVFVCLGISMAPASLLTNLTEGRDDIALQSSRGTVWQGQADVLSQGRTLGALRWSIHPLALLGLELSADWQFDQPFAQLQGTASLDDRIAISADGRVQANAVNEWVKQYDIYLEGNFTVADVSVLLNRDQAQLELLNGSVRWSGGLVRFTLSGLLHEEFLPPMLATLMTAEDQPQVVVVAEGESTPLMIIQPGQYGYIKVGITKHFTEMLDRPWPGSHPAHTVVLEVEEKIY